MTSIIEIYKKMTAKEMLSALELAILQSGTYTKKEQEAVATLKKTFGVK